MTDAFPQERKEFSMKAIEMIEAQQKGKEGTQAFMVGQQLKDICRRDPHCAELVAEDLSNVAMSLENAAGKIKAHADELNRQQKGNFVCITPDVAENIIREFYGLPSAGDQSATQAPALADDGFLDLADFLT